MITARVAELERQLSRTAHNFSQPSSADGPAVPIRAGRRRGSDRRPGKQPSADQRSLGVVADPDEIVEHGPVYLVGYHLGPGPDRLGSGPSTTAEVLRVGETPATSPGRGGGSTSRPPRC